MEIVHKMKIGIVDDYLDNWHTNHYPFYLKLASELYQIPAEITCAYAWRNHPEEGMLSTSQWCVKYGVKECSTYEELIEQVDAIMVMCADNCIPHEKLAQQALESGKPVFCDKTFAPDYATAKRMFDVAREHGTRVFSCSAQRFCMELLCFQSQVQQHVDYCSTTGPGDMVNYSIHQYEMLESMMGTGAKKCIANQVGDVKQIVYEYDDDRTCAFHIGDKLHFTLTVKSEQGKLQDIAVTDYYLNFFLKLLQFFAGGEVPVKEQDTLEIMTMQQAGRQALEHPGNWVYLSECRQ